jgi:prepilin peptidase CpaA
MGLPLLSWLLLATVLLAAVVSDLRRRRIPNALVLYGLLTGLALQAFAPAGAGLLQDGGQGLGPALAGGLAGLALFLPMWLLRILGAGDVKLMAVVGVWLGTAAVLQAALWTLLAGGVLALVMAVASGTLRQVLFNTVLVLTSHAPPLATQPQAAPGLRLPYAVAIAAGSAVEMARLALA